MRVDLHVHCRPVSLCAWYEPELLPAILQKAGVDAFVLTNHCYPVHCDPLGATFEEQAREYVKTYHRCRKAGEAIGVKVFFGVELKLIHEPHCPEFLLYGISEEDFLDSYPLYGKTQAEVFAYCNEKDILMVQAHPYRTEQGYAPADMRYVHGIEIYNPHLLFDARFEDALNLAISNGKCKTAGSDFHTEAQAGLAGLIVPDTVTDQFSLRDYLRTEKVQVFDKNGILYEES